MSEVRRCAQCRVPFEPSRSQLAIERRKRFPLYCSTECQKEAAAARSRAFWNSEAGREYSRNRYRHTHPEED